MSGSAERAGADLLKLAAERSELERERARVDVAARRRPRDAGDEAETLLAGLVRERDEAAARAEAARTRAESLDPRGGIAPERARQPRRPPRLARGDGGHALRLRRGRARPARGARGHRGRSASWPTRSRPIRCHERAVEAFLGDRAAGRARARRRARAARDPAPPGVGGGPRRLPAPRLRPHAVRLRSPARDRPRGAHGQGPAVRPLSRDRPARRPHPRLPAGRPRRGDAGGRARDRGAPWPGRLRHARRRDAARVLWSRADAGSRACSRPGARSARARRGGKTIEIGSAGRSRRRGRGGRDGRRRLRREARALRRAHPRRGEGPGGHPPRPGRRGGRAVAARAQGRRSSTRSASQAEEEQGAAAVRLAEIEQRSCTAEDAEREEGSRAARRPSAAAVAEARAAAETAQARSSEARSGAGRAARARWRRRRTSAGACQDRRGGAARAHRRGAGPRPGDGGPPRGPPGGAARVRAPARGGPDRPRSRDRTRPPSPRTACATCANELEGREQGAEGAPPRARHAARRALASWRSRRPATAPTSTTSPASASRRWA